MSMKRLSVARHEQATNIKPQDGGSPFKGVGKHPQLYETTFSSREQAIFAYASEALHIARASNNG